MDTPIYIIYDNKLLRADAPVLSIANRAFRYGDGLFESIRVINGSPLFVDLHIERIANAMQLLGMQPIPDLSVNTLVAQIKILLQRNACGNDARVRFSIFRKDGGLYTPRTNQVSYTLEAYPMSTNGYEWNSKGVNLGIYTDHLKPFTHFSKIKSANALLYVMAAQHAENHKLDDVLLLNQNNKIIETSNSNLFYLLDNKLYTPPLSDGCLSGVLRFVVLALAIENDVEIEERSFSKDDVPSIKEAFITNTISGIRWVGGLNNARYFNHTARQFYEYLLHKLDTMPNKSLFF